MGTIKDRNGMDLTEAEDIKKKWQEYTEELLTTTKKDINVPDSHNGVITDLQSDIMEWEVLRKHHYKQASGGDGIPAELFPILKDDAVQVLHSIYQKIWKTNVSIGLEKHPFSSQSQRRSMPKNVQTTP